jgi:predicted nucleotidyltransferase
VADGLKIFMQFTKLLYFEVKLLNQEVIEINNVIKSNVDVERIYLFGSYAYGTPDDDSDFDFYMVIPDNGIKPLEAVKQARLALISYNRKSAVDIFADSHSRFEQRSKLNTLERKIINEGVLLYERE